MNTSSLNISAPVIVILELEYGRKEGKCKTSLPSYLAGLEA